MRRLVVCCDGTWNTPDRRDRNSFAPSNVVKLARAILPIAQPEVSQISFYDPGVGTANLFDRLSGGAFGVGLSTNVREAYLFLVHNYAPGDEIYLFGFSRGAYTVRSVAGMIRKAGLLQKPYADRALAAWNLYRKRDAGPDTPEAQAFRESYSRFPLRVRFIGVWDTVGALGIPGLLNFVGRSRFQFHDVALSRSVDFAYQALAIDEQRKFFRPSLWQQHPEAEAQVLEQAWFPGAHMDVGGGYLESGLSDAALLWMTEKAAEVGLEFDTDYLSGAERPDPRGALHDSRRFPYTLIPHYLRPIGQDIESDEMVYGPGHTSERVSDAALTRLSTDRSYKPRNLVEYLKRRD